MCVPVFDSYSFCHCEISGKGNVAPAPLSVPAFFAVPPASAPVVATSAVTASAAMDRTLVFMPPFLRGWFRRQCRAGPFGCGHPGGEPLVKSVLTALELAPAARQQGAREQAQDQHKRD